jgi:hypothetical protein
MLQVIKGGHDVADPASIPIHSILAVGQYMENWPDRNGKEGMSVRYMSFRYHLPSPPTQAILILSLLLAFHTF